MKDINRKVWECWSGNKKPDQKYKRDAIRELKHLKAPGVFLHRHELKILSVLNSDFMKKGKCISLIRWDTGVSVPTINGTLKRLKLLGLVTSELVKEKHKREKRISKLTEKGYKLLQEWKSIYFQI